MIRWANSPSFTADGAHDQDGVYGEVARHSPEAAVIVPLLRSRTDRRHGTEIALGVSVLARTLAFGRPEYLRLV